MTDEAWDAGFVKCLGVRLAGDLIGEVDERGEPIVGDTLLVLLNAHHEAIPFTLPAHAAGQDWELLLDTADPHRPARRATPCNRTCWVTVAGGVPHAAGGGGDRAGGDSAGPKRDGRFWRLR